MNVCMYVCMCVCMYHVSTYVCSLAVRVQYMYTVCQWRQGLLLAIYEILRVLPADKDCVCVCVCVCNVHLLQATFSYSIVRADVLLPP